MKKQKIKFLYLDLENSPSIGYVWAKYQTDVISFQKEWYVMSFAYKWEGDKTKVKALPDYQTYKIDPTDDSELVRELWEIMDEADVICGHNVDRFDIRKIQTRFLYHGLGLPSSFKTVDTLKIARKMLLMNSNKLDHLAQYLGIGEKIDTGGFKLWIDCMSGDKKAWKLMKEYNKHDVDLTEKVYKELRPFINNHPNANLYNGTTHSCPNCGSSDVQKRGYNYTRIGKRSRLQCVSCGAWSQGELVKTDVTVR